MVGDVNPQKTLAEVKKLFGDIPSRKLPPKPEVKLEPVKIDTLNSTTDLPYGLAIVSFRMPGTSSPDYFADII